MPSIASLAHNYARLGTRFLSALQSSWPGALSVRRVMFLLLGLSVLSGIATYRAVLREEYVMLWLSIDIALLLILSAVVFIHVLRMIIERRRGFAGARLMTRVVVMLSLVAVIPTLVMTAFSVLFFTFGVQAWFNERVSSAIAASVAVADGYLAEHKKIIQADILGIANDLNREAYRLQQRPAAFNQVVSVLASVRKLPEAIVFQRQPDGSSVILGRSHLSYALEFFLQELTPETLSRAENGELVTLSQEINSTDDSNDRIIALIRLDQFFETYLLVGRFVDPTILKHIEYTRGAASDYDALKAQSRRIQIIFYTAFVCLVIFILLAAIWFGTILARGLVAPVETLVIATEKLQRGDWQVRVPEDDDPDEIGVLARAFNRMTAELEAQRRELALAERRSAWSDVARRIAHEIKNPLTPIQLAAERLRRKYANQVTEPEIFNRCVETITRHVGDIGNMVEEFVAFARLPAPQSAPMSLEEIMRAAIFSQQCASPNITFEMGIIPGDTKINGDAGQIARALENLLKNAVEAMEDSKTADDNKKVIITWEQLAEHIVITIDDMGAGFADSLMTRATEPYITTKAKGTGLGLAIVHKILEDHRASMQLRNRKEGGARVVLRFLRLLEK
jgi:two-component system nitrogen regulation sensor histidine kinase NtrY